MAYFDRTHGDSNPVFESDRLATIDGSGNPINTTGVPVNVAGPHLEFFGIDFANGNSPAGQMGTGGAIEAVIKCIQQLATVAIYQVEDSNDSNFSVAVYPVGAWTRGTLQNAIEGLGTVNGYNLGSTYVYNDGFRLWF